MRSADIALIPVIKLLNWSFNLSPALRRLLRLLLADSDIPDSDFPDSETVDGANDDADLPRDAEAEVLFLNLFIKVFQ